MEIKTIAVTYTRKFNLGDYESLELSCSLWGQIDPKEEDAQGTTAGTGITAFMVDRITGQNEIDQVMLRRPRPLTRPTSCIGCKYYHGISYNGSPLICSVHPEGIEGAKCPDWQSF